MPAARMRSPCPCCPDEKSSCGKRVRGLLRLSCNTALGLISATWSWPARTWTALQDGSSWWPPDPMESGRLSASRAVGAAGARLPDTEKVTGSNPVPPTSTAHQCDLSRDRNSPEPCGRQCQAPAPGCRYSELITYVSPGFARPAPRGQPCGTVAARSAFRRPWTRQPLARAWQYQERWKAPGAMLDSGFGIRLFEVNRDAAVAW